MSGGRTAPASDARLLELDELLSERDRQIIRLVAQLKLVSGAQLRRVFFEPAIGSTGNGRHDGQLARRALLRLTRRGVLMRLERRIGGVKSGSDGFCYRLAPAGQRLVSFWDGTEATRGRRLPDPGERVVGHRLAVSELAVQLREAARQGDLELIAFEAEPDSWRQFLGSGALRTVLKPDAFVRLATLQFELPPYGLEFKGEAWDGGTLAEGVGFQAFCTAWGRQARRVLRPGAFLVAFGATRTFHRLVTGIEDGGLEIRDQLLWLHGRGVPKSGHLPGGRSTTLKPAYEPILLARAPLERGQTVRSSIERHGTGALNISATRLPRGGDAGATGYWPSHLVLGHHPACGADGAGCDPECVVPLINRLGPAGGPALTRLFYTAKATRVEREAGCEQLATSTAPIFSGKSGAVLPRANLHPTVKPLGLMRWLVRLVAPEGGVVLDPFAGSGSTGCGAVLEGRQFIGVEREAAYLPIARARLAYWASRAAEKANPSVEAS